MRCPSCGYLQPARTLCYNCSTPLHSANQDLLPSVTWGLLTPPPAIVTTIPAEATALAVATLASTVSPVDSPDAAPVALVSLNGDEPGVVVVHKTAEDEVAQRDSRPPEEVGASVDPDPPREDLTVASLEGTNGRPAPSLLPQPAGPQEALATASSGETSLLLPAAKVGPAISSIAAKAKIRHRKRRPLVLKEQRRIVGAFYLYELAIPLLTVPFSLGIGFNSPETQPFFALPGMLNIIPFWWVTSRYPLVRFHAWQAGLIGLLRFVFPLIVWNATHPEKYVYLLYVGPALWIGALFLYFAARKGSWGIFFLLQQRREREQYQAERIARRTALERAYIVARSVQPEPSSAAPVHAGEQNGATAPSEDDEPVITLFESAEKSQEPVASLRDSPQPMSRKPDEGVAPAPVFPLEHHEEVTMPAQHELPASSLSRPERLKDETLGSALPQEDLSRAQFIPHLPGTEGMLPSVLHQNGEKPVEIQVSMAVVNTFEKDVDPGNLESRLRHQAITPLYLEEQAGSPIKDHNGRE